MGEILSFTLYMYCLLKMFNKKPSSHLWWTGMLYFLIISTEVSFILKTFGGRTEHMRDSGASCAVHSITVFVTRESVHFWWPPSREYCPLLSDILAPQGFISTYTRVHYITLISQEESFCVTDSISTLIKNSAHDDGKKVDIFSISTVITQAQSRTDLVQ